MSDKIKLTFVWQNVANVWQSMWIFNCLAKNCKRWLAKFCQSFTKFCQTFTRFCQTFTKFCQTLAKFCQAITFFCQTINCLAKSYRSPWLWLHRCWWRMLETKCVGDKFEMLVTDLIHWENHQHAEKSWQHNGHQHNDVTNITGVISSLHLFSKWICHYLTSRPYPDLFKALTNLAGGQQEFTIFSFSRSLIKTAEMTIKGQTRAKLRNSNAFLDYEMKFLQRILISNSKSRL